MQPVVIGLDCSTTAATAIAWTASGLPRARGRVPIPSASPAPGHAEQNPEDWWLAAAEALRQCAGGLTGAPILALGITFQRETLGLLDAAGKPTRPAILWHDSRAAQEVHDLSERLGSERIHGMTGKQVDVTAAGAKLLWLHRHEPEALRHATDLVDVSAFLTRQLIGAMVTVSCGVDTAGLCTLDGRWWGPPLEAAEAARLRLPELLPPMTVAGHLGAAAAAACGLPSGLPVVVAGGDGHCFTHAALTAFGNRKAATLTLGTSAVLGIEVGTPIVGEAFRTLIGCRSGSFVLESVIQCGSATLSWFDEVFAARAGLSPAAWDRQCSLVPPGSHGLLVLPHWRGVRVPRPDPLARGVVLGWNDRVTEAAFRRAVMEGMACEFRRLLGLVGTAAGTVPEALVVGGGGAAADVWCGILADVMDLPVWRLPVLDLSSLGAAWCAIEAIQAGPPKPDAAAAATQFPPDPERVRFYRQLAEIHADAYMATRDLSHRLAKLR